MKLIEQEELPCAIKRSPVCLCIWLAQSRNVVNGSTRIGRRFFAFGTRAQVIASKNSASRRRNSDFPLPRLFFAWLVYVPRCNSR